MEIKLTKKVDVKTQITWYYVFSDSTCVHATTSESDAESLYERIRTDKMKYVETVIKQETIDI